MSCKLDPGNLLATAYEPKYGKTVLNDQQELQYVSYFIERGNFWKIDNITIGYTLKLKNDYLKGYVYTQPVITYSHLQDTVD